MIEVKNVTNNNSKPNRLDEWKCNNNNDNTKWIYNTISNRKYFGNVEYI